MKENRWFAVAAWENISGERSCSILPCAAFDDCRRDWQRQIRLHESLITSMLFKFKPDELKLIMADPRWSSFASTLPHLIVGDHGGRKVSLAALAINEMERRYRMRERSKSATSRNSTGGRRRRRSSLMRMAIRFRTNFLSSSLSLMKLPM